MTGSSDTFRTFCHISEYGTRGYENLHRMIAASAPLVLWSPSSALLTSEACRVEPGEFVRYVEQGDVRIVGRGEWLLDQSYRDGHRWAAARWDDAIDGAIRSICQNDEREEHPRVFVAPPEEGFARAKELVGEHPEYVAALNRVFNSRRAEQQIPIGTIETAQGLNTGAESVAVAILRDAYNHGQAIDLVRPEAPFLLSSQDSRFLRLLAKFRAPTPVRSPSRSPAELKKTRNIAALTQELIDVLRYMDTAKDPGNLRRFMSGAGHRLLTQWFARICEDAKSEDPARLDGKIVKELRRDLRLGQFRTSWRELLGGPVGQTMLLSGTATAIVGAALDPMNVLSLTGLVTGVYPVGEGLLKKLGWIRADYTGQQWPFLYTYGSEASARLHSSMTRILDQAP